MGDAEHRPGVGRRRLLTELMGVGVVFGILSVIVYQAIQPVHVMGSSMSPTIHDRDLLIATRVDYHLHHPQRGDIVLLRDPYDESQDFIKRVIAIPGDRLRIADGNVYVNGAQTIEPYRAETTCAGGRICNWPPENLEQGIEIPPDEFFVMGDNRNNSTDSRRFGLIQGGQIEARAWIRIWPNAGGL